MAKQTRRTRGDRMRERGAAQFAGRSNETRVFEKALDVIVRREESKIREAKTTFNIYGEGGMGKTWLLWEYERICRAKGVQPIYIQKFPDSVIQAQ
jgi:hypothetical protein